MLRFIKILLIAAVAVFLLMGAIFNVVGWKGTVGAVAATTTMATIEGDATHWQATSNPAVIVSGAVFITSLKIVAGLLCAAGAVRMWARRKDTQMAFSSSKEMALTGCGVAMFLLYFGWIVIAETWFELWRSDALRDVALQSAFRYGGMIILIALFVASDND